MSQVCTTGSGHIRVLVCDDHPLARLGTVALCQLAGEDIEVVGETDNGAGAITLAETLVPDVILMDLQMPVMDGVAATQRIRGPRVIMLSSVDTDGDVFRALEAGAVAFLRKDVGADELGRAIREAFTEGAVTVASDRLGQVSTPPLSRLTEREIQVLELAAKGMTNFSIGSALAISTETVKTYLARASEKLGTVDRTSAVYEARRLGWLQ